MPVSCDGKQVSGQASMHVIQAVYRIWAVREIFPVDANSVLADSRENNAARYITGLLCNNEPYFIQLLEGGFREINDLYHRIVADYRHEKVALLLYRNTDVRVFPDRAMGRIDNDQYMTTF